VEGVQGRYFLPLAPALLLPFAGVLKNRVAALVVFVLYEIAAIAINVDAYVTLVARYY
jgi:uncharacterized membrane protein